MAIIYHIPNEQLRQRGLHPRLQANNRLMFITHETAQHSIPEQVEAVLNRRYRETGKARVFTITDAALRELLGSTAPYAPPVLPFYTSEGSVLDVPPLKAP